MQKEKAKSHGEQHVSTKVYWQVAIYLSIITAVEVAIFYIEALAPVLAPLLIILSLAKFALVALYFMHLRFDKVILTGLFGAGFAIAIAITLGVLAQQGSSYIGPGI